MKLEIFVPHPPARSARIEARLAPEVLATVKRAAELQGRSVSDFVVCAARDAANRTIEEAEIVRLSIAGQKAFADALISPPVPSSGLNRAFTRHRRLVREIR
jgi:uncharacterized protein (DUF1778 family)